MNKIFAIVAVSVGVFIWLASGPAQAEGEVVCIIATGATATDTQLITDGGSACSWAAGAAVAMQCPNAKVCYDPAVLPRRIDGGSAPGSPIATADDLCANFLVASGNPDPYLIYLNADQKSIGLIATEIGDGGVSVNCKMAKTRRRSPSN